MKWTLLTGGRAGPTSKRPFPHPVFAACVVTLMLGSAVAHATAPALPPLDPQAVHSESMISPEKEREELMRYIAPDAAVRIEDRLTALHFITTSYEMQGRYDKAIDLAQQWYALADQQHDIRNKAQALSELGASNSPIGRLDVAVRSLKSAAELASAAKDPETWSSALFNLSVLMLNYGDYENALTYSLEAQKVMQQHGGMSFPASGYGERANIYYRLGRYEEADRALQEAEKGLPDTDNTGTMQVSGMLARVDEKLGRLVEAKANAERCTGIQKRLKAAVGETYECELVLAELATRQGALAEAKRHLDTLKQVLDKTPESAGVGKAVMERDYRQSLGELAKAEGRWRDAADHEAIVAELDRRLWSARDSSRAAVAAAEIKAEGKDLSIALLETRNANLRLEARQRLMFATSAIVSGLAILCGLFLWYRARQMRMRQEQRHAERTRIARELHDTLLQNMAGAQMQLQAVAMLARAENPSLATRLGSMVEELGASMASARDAVWQMRSAAIERGDLVEALEEWIGLARTRTAATITFDASAGEGAYRPSQGEDIFRIAQEAVGNAIRHASSGLITVRIARSPKTIELSVTDHGRGFDAKAGSSDFGGHWGLIGMRERAVRLDGSLAIESAPGTGTEVVLTVPV